MSENLAIFFTSFSTDVCDFPDFLYLVTYYNSELIFGFLIKFYIDYSGAHIFFFHFCIIEETQRCKNLKKKPFAETGANTIPKSDLLHKHCFRKKYIILEKKMNFISYTFNTCIAKHYSKKMCL